MGCAYNELIKTPNLDRLAGEGVHFTHANTNCTVCMPARASLVSGLYSHNHGMWGISGELPASDETFFHHLQQAGYFTAHIGKSHYYCDSVHMKDREPYMHSRGLEYVHETQGTKGVLLTESYFTDYLKEKGLLSVMREDYILRKKNNCPAHPSPLSVEDCLDGYVGRRAVDFVSEYKDERPMCLFVGFPGPHVFRDPSGKYAGMYKPQDMPESIPAGEIPGWLPDSARERMVGGQERFRRISGEHLAKIKASYYGKISLIDYWIGEILRSFEKKGWLDDLFVVFCSDHGEMLGDHGLLAKTVFYESSVRIPFIIRHPLSIKPGQKNDSLVETIDIFPTLLEVAGAEPSHRCLGKSLYQTVNNPGSIHRKGVLSEVYSTTFNFMVRTRRYKYAVEKGGEPIFLYDLEKDPDEQVNLAGSDKAKNLESEARDELLRLLTSAQWTM